MRKAHDDLPPHLRPEPPPALAEVPLDVPLEVPPEPPPGPASADRNQRPPDPFLRRS